MAFFVIICLFSWWWTYFCCWVQTLSPLRALFVCLIWPFTPNSFCVSLLISLSPLLLLRLDFQRTVNSEETKNTPFYCTLFAKVFSVKITLQTLLLLCRGSPLQPLSCKWSWALFIYLFFFSKERILKRSPHFCLWILSQTLFSPISSPPLPPSQPQP